MQGNYEPRPVTLQASNPEQLITILKETEGNLVLDGGPNHGVEKRPFYRAIAGRIQVVKVLPEDGGSSRVSSFEIREEEFMNRLAEGEFFRIWPVSDSPFTAVSNNSGSASDDQDEYNPEKTPLHDGLEF